MYVCILSQECFLTLQFLFAFWVQICLEFYENIMHDYDPHRYISKRSYSMIKKDLIFLRDLYQICIKQTHNMLNSLIIPYGGAQPSVLKFGGLKPPLPRGSYGHLLALHWNSIAPPPWALLSIQISLSYFFSWENYSFNY